MRKVGERLTPSPIGTRGVCPITRQSSWFAFKLIISTCNCKIVIIFLFLPEKRLAWLKEISCNLWLYNFVIFAQSCTLFHNILLTKGKWRITWTFVLGRLAPRSPRAQVWVRGSLHKQSHHTLASLDADKVKEAPLEKSLKAEKEALSRKRWEPSRRRSSRRCRRGRPPLRHRILCWRRRWRVFDAITIFGLVVWLYWDEDWIFEVWCSLYFQVVQLLWRKWRNDSRSPWGFVGTNNWSSNR